MRPQLVLVCCAALAACEKPAPALPAAAPPPPGAQEALDRLDGRRPVPLLAMMANHQKQNMRDHLIAVQEITSALATSDFAAVEKAAGRIGFSEQMGQMCNHMGSGAPGFTDAALAFHRTADGIAVAARERDREKVLASLGATLQACTGCHATWRQQVVTEAEWTRLTASAAPTGHHP
ncbi:MAG: cytochrome c [Myxococcaceae bacterium]|nr:cytochrome c [Myxococcaceae bacterium]